VTSQHKFYVIDYYVTQQRSTLYHMRCILLCNFNTYKAINIEYKNCI